MTHNQKQFRPKIALFEPDIPQNTASIIRTCSCLGAYLEIIEPCGFLFSDKRFKRVVMDYFDEDKIKFYNSSEEFFESKKKFEDFQNRRRFFEIRKISTFIFTTETQLPILSGRRDATVHRM